MLLRDIFYKHLYDKRNPHNTQVEVKNYCINPNKTVNQRTFSGTWSSVSVGAYGYDRWRRGVASGTIEQPVINTTIQGASYVLAWEGGGSGEIQQSSSTVVSGTSPLVATLTDNVQAILVVPEAVTNVKFHLGKYEQNVMLRTYEEEYTLCEPYAQPLFSASSAYVSIAYCNDSTRAWLNAVKFPRMIANPVLYTAPTVTLHSRSSATIGTVSSVTILNTRENFITTDVIGSGFSSAATYARVSNGLLEAEL